MHDNSRRAAVSAAAVTASTDATAIADKHTSRSRSTAIVPVSNSAPAADDLTDDCVKSTKHLKGIVDDVDRIQDCQDPAVLRQLVRDLLRQVLELTAQQANNDKALAAVKKAANQFSVQNASMTAQFQALEVLVTGVPARMPKEDDTPDLETWVLSMQRVAGPILQVSSSNSDTGEVFVFHLKPPLAAVAEGNNTH